MDVSEKGREREKIFENYSWMNSLAWKGSFLWNWDERERKKKIDRECVGGSFGGRKYMPWKHMNFVPYVVCKKKWNKYYITNEGWHYCFSILIDWQNLPLVNENDSGKGFVSELFGEMTKIFIFN